MAQKIVILNGSPRKNGNTSALVKAFTEGAESAGHSVTAFFLDGMDIHGSPLYYWTMSGQLRTAVDRLFALEEGGGNLLRGNGKASALLMAAEGHGFEDALQYYNHLMEHLRWRNLGHVLAGGNTDAGDIQGKSELQQAFELGKSI